VQKFLLISRLIAALALLAFRLLGDIGTVFMNTDKTFLAFEQFKIQVIG